MSPRSKQTEMLQPFFVYVTLLPGQPNSYLWHKEIITSHPARFLGGRLYDMGNYPMLVETIKGVVQGQLIYLEPERYGQTKRLVDALEGYDEESPESSVYVRRLRDISLRGDGQVKAWVYLGRVKYVADAPLIEHGNWAHYVEGELNQIQDWWRNIDTVSGMHERK